MDSVKQAGPGRIDPRLHLEFKIFKYSNSVKRRILASVRITWKPEYARPPHLFSLPHTAHVVVENLSYRGSLTYFSVIWLLILAIWPVSCDISSCHWLMVRSGTLNFEKRWWKSSQSVKRAGPSWIIQGHTQICCTTSKSLLICRPYLKKNFWDSNDPPSPPTASLMHITAWPWTLTSVRPLPLRSPSRTFGPIHWLGPLFCFCQLPHVCYLLHQFCPSN